MTPEPAQREEGGREGARERGREQGGAREEAAGLPMSRMEA